MPPSRRFALLAVVALALGCSHDGTAVAGDESSSEAGSSGQSDERATSDSSGDSAVDPPNEAPVAMFVAAVHVGDPTTTVTFDASTSTDVDGAIVAYEWTFANGPDAGVEITRPFAVGCHAVELTVIDDDGASDSAQATVVVALGEPELEPVVGLDESPLASAVLPRDLATNEGVASFAVVVASNGYTELRAELLADDVVRSTYAAPLCGVAPLELALGVPIPAELTSFAVRLSLVGGDQVVEVARVDDLVAGDLYLVSGQSNAAANPQSGAANENQGQFVRSFGSRTDDGTVSDGDRTWRIADGDGGSGVASVGQWALRMGAQLAAAHRVPIGILNGARAGMPIEFFQRNDADPADLTTNYGRLLVRTRNAGIDRSIRGILWYQGEADGTDFQAHLSGFLALGADWSADYPSVERTYVTQVRLGCGGNLIRTQEVQRELADEFADISVMATNGLDGHDGCHYAYEQGYRELGDQYAALLGRDLYGAAPDHDVEPPNPASAWFAAGGTQIIVAMRNTESMVTCDEGAAADFRIHAGGDSIVTDCVATGHELVLTVAGDASAATGLNYLGHVGAGPWVTNENGLGLLSFWKLPIEPERPG
jgi:PKD repeat protein